jgi:endonuclease/exonuclease/phosphatase family metal-dependent hydrolase
MTNVQRPVKRGRGGRGWRARGLVLVCAFACLVARGAAETLSIATYNVANYTLADRRLADGGFRPEYPKPEDEKAALRRVIAAMDADVIALQEMGGAGFLAELRRDLASEGLVYPHGEAPAGPDEARGLAVLSRVPLGRVVLHDDLRAKRRGAEAGEPVRRGLLQVEIPTTDGVVTLFVVHLKSRLTATSEDPAAEDQRVAEAQAARDRVLELFPEPATARFVIAGDFNDTPGSRTLRAVQARGKIEIATWLDAADERGQRWTHAYERIAVYSRFDHALVSEGLRRGEPERARVRIIGEPWQAVKVASDHRPLVLTLRVGE